MWSNFPRRIVCCIVWLVQLLREYQPASDEPFILRLSDEAVDLLESWEREIESQLAEGGDMELTTDWGGKLAGATVRIAAIFHCVQYSPAGRIDAPTIAAAIEIARYRNASHPNLSRIGGRVTGGLGRRGNQSTVRLANSSRRQRGGIKKALDKCHYCCWRHAMGKTLDGPSRNSGHRTSRDFSGPRCRILDRSRRPRGQTKLHTSHGRTFSRGLWR